MPVHVYRKFQALLPLLFIVLIVAVTTPSRAHVPPVAQTKLIVDEVLPEPPRQHDVWRAPETIIPSDFVDAVHHLFRMGLADPRGCSYCEIEILTGTSRLAHLAPTRTHGWVLPAREGDKRRFAVCWSGLVYPVITVQSRANLQQDVREAMVERSESENRQERKYGEERTVAYESIDDLGTALLLRLGDGKLAWAVWTRNHPPHDAEAAPSGRTQLSLLLVAARNQFDRGKAAHIRGDDAVALDAFRKLTVFARQAEHEARRYGFEPSKDSPAFLTLLDQLPVLLQDQERRAKHDPLSSIVCVGPGKHADVNKRIAALIARLDEIDFESSAWGLRGDEPIIDALVHEGQPALEPLLKCLEDDRRLTRWFDTGRHFDGTGKFADVRTLVTEAVQHILSRAYFEPGTEEKDRPSNPYLNKDQALKKDPAALFREKAQKAQWLSPEDLRAKATKYCWKILNDDKLTPKDWSSSAGRLVEPTSASSVSPYLKGTLWTKDAKVGPLHGEILRHKKDPSVTDLLLKRIDDSHDDETTTRLVLALAEWEPKAALAPLRKHMLQLQTKAGWRDYVMLVRKRCELGDTKALEDYVTWIRMATPQILQGSIDDGVFYPMWHNPDFPGMAEAAEKLFGDKTSPWLKPYEAARTTWLIYLMSTDMLRIKAFLQAVVKELTNKSSMGTIDIDPSGLTKINLPWLSTNRYGPGIRDFDVPEGGAKGAFRICDYLAFEIGSHFPGAPQCELYWPEKRRDLAVSQCAQYLRDHATPLYLHEPEVKKHEKPATEADFHAGEAVFSLADEGETRLVAGLALPQIARWMTLQYRPYLYIEKTDAQGRTIVSTAYRQSGNVVQAEEVMKDGKWCRYYGFVGSNHNACVPAEQIEFPISRRDRQHGWIPLANGFHSRLQLPPLSVELIDGFPPRFPANPSLRFGIVVRNSHGIDQMSPVTRECVRLQLLYSPETISRKGALVPVAVRESEWTQLKPRPTAAFEDEKSKLLGPTEEMKIATFDLSDRYDLSRPGFYRLLLLASSDDVPASEAPPEVSFSLAPSEPLAHGDR